MSSAVSAASDGDASFAGVVVSEASSEASPPGEGAEDAIGVSPFAAGDADPGVDGNSIGPVGGLHRFGDGFHRADAVVRRVDDVVLMRERGSGEGGAGEETRKRRNPAHLRMMMIAIAKRRRTRRAG